MIHTKIKYEPVCKNGSWRFGGHAITFLYDHNWPERKIELRIFGKTKKEAKVKMQESLK